MIEEVEFEESYQLQFTTPMAQISIIGYFYDLDEGGNGTSEAIFRHLNKLAVLTNKLKVKA